MASNFSLNKKKRNLQTHHHHQDHVLCVCVCVSTIAANSTCPVVLCMMIMDTSRDSSLCLFGRVCVKREKKVIRLVKGCQSQKMNWFWLTRSNHVLSLTPSHSARKVNQKIKSCPKLVLHLSIVDWVVCVCVLWSLHTLPTSGCSHMTIQFFSDRLGRCRPAIHSTSLRLIAVFEPRLWFFLSHCVI